MNVWDQHLWSNIWRKKKKGSGMSFFSPSKLGLLSFTCGTGAVHEHVNIHMW